MIILDGIKNFMVFINENWTMIVALIGLGVAVYRKIRVFLAKSKDEQIAFAKKMIKEIILKYVADAEDEYMDLEKAGSIKRAQVIGRIYDAFPILAEIAEQEQILAFIDDCIDEALETLRKVLKENEILPE